MADIKCEDPFGAPVIVQCKHYARSGSTVTSPMIQVFYGMTMAHRAAYGIYVTTSTFTAPARRFARDSGDVYLVDGDDLRGGRMATIMRPRFGDVPATHAEVSKSATRLPSTVRDADQRPTPGLGDSSRSRFGGPRKTAT
jgi:Restriction endonuclease